MSSRRLLLTLSRMLDDAGVSYIIMLYPLSMSGSFGRNAFYIEAFDGGLVMVSSIGGEITSEHVSVDDAFRAITEGMK